MAKISDLAYKVVRIPTAFSPAGHMLVFYRHDKDGNPYVDDVSYFYGPNGRYTRHIACQRGRNVVAGNEPRGLRSLFVKADAQKAFAALGMPLERDYV